MADFDALNEALSTTVDELDGGHLEPSPERRQQLQQQSSGIERLQRRFQDEILAVLPELEEQLDPEEVPDLREIVALLAGRVAAVMLLVDRAGDARALLSTASAMLPPGTLRHAVEEGMTQVAPFIQLQHVRWIARQGEVERARTLAKELRHVEQQAPGIAASAKPFIEAPKPLTSAPTLFTLNGVGARMYGDRDHDRDGSYVSTRYFTVLFVPVIPIDAYRVIAYEDDSYQFLCRAPLSSLAKAWQRLFAAALVIGVFGLAFSAWYSSPGRHLGIALEEAAELEAAAKDDPSRLAAIERYETIIFETLDEEDVAAAKLQPAAAAIMRLSAAKVPRPLKSSDLVQALAAIQRFTALPSGVRGGSAADEATEVVSGWADDLGGGDEAKLSASLRLLEGGVLIAPEGPLAQRRDEVRLALAKQLSASWPIDAFRLFGACEGAEAVAGGKSLLAQLRQDKAVVRELANELLTWSENARREGDSAIAQDIRDLVGEAQAQGKDPQRIKLLEAGEEAELRAALGKSSKDQELTVALAQLLQGKGEGQQALELLGKLGKPGQLTTDARLTLANIMAGTGQRDEAEKLLARTLSFLLGPYQAAVTSYSAAAEKLERDLVSKARAGNLPSSIEDELTNAPESKRQQIFSEWLQGELQRDPELSVLRGRMTGLSHVVPLAVTLATLELSHASEVSGKRRQQLLASAEQHFLSVQLGASGLPSYHMGLGQVYHRLGKAEQGEAELKKLLARNDPLVSLAVARVYRELGLHARAVAEATKVHTASAEQRSSAAVLLSLLASTREERESWLRKADTNDPFVRTSLLEVEGDKLREQGKLAEADQKYAQVAVEFEKTAKTDSAGANNAALAWISRYQCTGNEQHLVKATELMKGALELSPNSPLVMSNTAPILQHRAALTVLTRYVNTKQLRLSSGQADLVLSTLLDGPRQDQVRSALARNPHYTRGRELLKQAQVLAPRQPHNWTAQVNVLGEMKDREGLEKLLLRLKAAPKLDVSASRKSQQEWREGKHDARSLQSLQTRITLLKRTEERVTDTKSRAVVQLLLADLEDDLSLFEKPLEHTRASVAAYRKAHELWPELGVARVLAGQLAQLALLSTAESDSARLEKLRQQLRLHGTSQLLHTAALDGTTLAQLRQRPELKEAAKLRLEASKLNPSVSDWVIGDIAQDEELRESGRRAFESALVLLPSQIAMQMDPENDGSARYAALLERGAKSY